MGLLLEKRLCLSCHLDLELIVVLDDARQRGKALELEPEECPIGAVITQRASMEHLVGLPCQLRLRRRYASVGATALIPSLKSP